MKEVTQSWTISSSRVPAKSRHLGHREEKPGDKENTNLINIIRNRKPEIRDENKKRKCRAKRG